MSNPTSTVPTPAPGNPASPETQLIMVLIRAQGSGLERLLGLLRRRATTLAILQISLIRDQNMATASLSIHGNRTAALALVEHIRKLTDVLQATVIDAEI